MNGKRIRVSLENVQRIPIAREYHYALKNSILAKLRQYDEGVSVRAHNEWNYFFVFSGLLGKLWNTDIGLYFKSVDIVIASPEYDMIKGLSNAMVIDPLLDLNGVKLRVSQIKVENIRIEDGISTLNYETLGEIVIKKGDKNGVTHHVTVDDDLSEALKQTIEIQAGAATGTSTEVFVEVLSAKQRKRAIYKDDKLINSFIALRLSFSLRADARIHEFLLTQGLGHHRKMGFGMLSTRLGRGPRS